MEESGLDPTLGAILPLIGVLVGAALAGAVRYFLDRRDEKARFRAAVWLLADDLERLRQLLDPQAGPAGALGVPQSPLHSDPALRSWLHVDSWGSQREVLARGLLDHHDVWDHVRWTVMSADVLYRLYEEAPGGGTDSIMRRHTTHDELAERVNGTLEALKPFGLRARRGRWWHRMASWRPRRRRLEARSRAQSGFGLRDIAGDRGPCKGVPMGDVTYSFHSGSQPVTSQLQEPVTDLDVAKRVGREISETTNQRDTTIIVRSHKVELQGQAEWRGIAAVFINGEEIGPDDDRYPHDATP